MGLLLLRVGDHLGQNPLILLPRHLVAICLGAAGHDIKRVIGEHVTGGDLVLRVKIPRAGEALAALKFCDENKK